MEHERIVIVGGGIVGLSLGWQLARRGRSVEILERDRAGRGASWVAAGMLAPGAEAGFEEEDLLRLTEASLRLYPQCIQELEEDSGRKVAMDRSGSLMIGLNRDDVERLRRLMRFRERVGLAAEWLDGAVAREREPLLSPRTCAAVWMPGDAQVNNRAMVEALIRGVKSRGGKIHEETPVRSISIRNGRVRGVRAGEEMMEAETVVVAAGCWSRDIAGIPTAIAPAVRPVKGQILTLRMSDACRPKHAVRAPDVYLAPKDDGRLMVGATSEEMGFDTLPTAGPIMKLLQRAWEAMPAIYELHLEEIQVGLRPGSRDHAPLLGGTDVQGLFYATGHYRHGILLTPITAYAMSELLTTGRCPDVLRPFSPMRFANRRLDS